MENNRYIRYYDSFMDNYINWKWGVDHWWCRVNNKNGSLLFPRKITWYKFTKYGVDKTIRQK